MSHFLCHLENTKLAAFNSFEQFFDTPSTDSAAPQALGFEGFFRGAYSYHFHNFWHVVYFKHFGFFPLTSFVLYRWKPFDPARNWPDLGPRFAEGERMVRRALRQTDPSKGQQQIRYGDEEYEDRVEDDRRDLDWSTVLKRTFEAYIRGERPSMYGEMLRW